ncbi:MAG: hypothetical protein AB7O04_04275 [Hyphomonadaceae bacterium]
MNGRLIAMWAGTLLCLAPVYVAPIVLARAPLSFELQFQSFSAFVGWAYVLAMALLPVVCIGSIMRGWFAWVSGPREAALKRLLLWPAVGVAVCAALFGLSILLTMN